MLGIQNRRRDRTSRGSTQSPTRDLEQRQHRSTDKTMSSRAQPREKTLLDHWMEPSLAEKPSYRDHGGSAYGVLEHMQPLGEAPSVRVRARVKPDVSRRSNGPKLATSGDGDAMDTPEGTPVPSSAVISQEDAPPAPHVDVDDERDADFAPRGSSTGKRKERPARSQPSKSRGVTTSTVAPTATKTTNTTSSKKSAPAPVRACSEKKLKLIVEAAKKRAMENQKPDVAAAVDEIYLKSRNDLQLRDLLDAILTKKAGSEQINIFHTYVRDAKKKVKAAKKMPQPEQTEAANGTISINEPHPPPPATPTTEVQATSTQTNRAKLSLKVKSPTKPPRGRPPGRMNHSPAKRSGSVGSDSSLTSMTSNEEDSNVAGSKQHQSAAAARPVAKTNGSRARDHITERESLVGPQRGTKRSSADAEIQDDDDRERLLASKKQRLGLLVERGQDFPESSIRQVRNGTLATRTRTSHTHRNTLSELDSPLSSPRSARPSRHASMRPEELPQKTFTRKAKIKQSPEKKNPSGYNGLSGVSGAVPGSPIGPDDNEDLSENNDFCSACGASGFLLCCDGCDRSFHFSCLDPPLSENASELNEPWYCYLCVAKRPLTAEQTDKVPRGLFASLFNNLRKRNPSNFSLPQELRDYFEGVGGDKHGNFIEAVHARQKNRAGYDEAPDYTKLKDAKGNTVLCYSCSRSSQGTRPLIQCDYCGQYWHLDCLDPPLANPPALSMESKKVHDWMCPLHADQELRKFDTRLLYPRRTIHIRKPRNAKIVETSLNRGFRNNGVIEIVDDTTDDSDSEFYDEETQDEGVVYRLPASGIKLDFIDKIKNTRVQEMRNEAAYRRARAVARPPRQLQQANFTRRSFRDKQMAIMLTQFARANQDLDMDGTSIENLLAALIAEAPPEVVEQMMLAEESENAYSSSSAAPPSPPSSEQTDQLTVTQRKQMLLLQELIRRRLETGKP